MEYKQVILVREDLKLTKGKMSAQASHASVAAVLKTHKDDLSKWMNAGQKKVILKVTNKEELYAYKQQAEDAGLTTAVITDAGHTHLQPGTVTCMAIGPDKEDKIDKITGKLKLIG